jgi:hypothetical protein
MKIGKYERNEPWKSEGDPFACEMSVGEKSVVKNVTTLCVKKAVGGKSLDQWKERGWGIRR